MGAEIIILCLALTVVSGVEVVNEKRQKALQPFQVVVFPNDVCNGGSRNGSCLTTDECESKGGISSGSCADGYGVCCVVSLDCGGSTNLNVSYLVKTETTSFSGPCSYKICPNNPAVCRIRFDFQSFNIAQPVRGLVVDNTANLVSGQGGGMGNCITDSFSVSSPGTRGSPLICGENVGQHMIVDIGTKGSCVTAAFLIGQTTTVSRNWDIKVTQYDCGNEMGGPQGCLQYFTGVSQTFASFNFPTTASAVTSRVTHLASQKYDICIRREHGYCIICYQPTIMVASPSATSQNSFGLSTAPASATVVNTNCVTDYLAIPAGTTRAIAVMMTSTSTSATSRICGRQFSSVSAATSPASVCSKSKPFVVSFVSDGYEVSTGSTSATSEEALSPGGIIGFQLTYTQLPCGTTA